MERYSDHRACHRINVLEVEKYSRFLWSVNMSMGDAEPSRW